MDKSNQKTFFKLVICLFHEKGIDKRIRMHFFYKKNRPLTRCNAPPITSNKKSSKEFTGITFYVLHRDFEFLKCINLQLIGLEIKLGKGRGLKESVNWAKNLSYFFFK